jgi:hypothetical protein
LRPLGTPFVLVSLLALAAGCGSGGGGGGAGASSGGAGGAGGGGSQAVPCDSAPADLDLEGTWAAYGRLAVTLQGVPGGAITICPADQVGESTMLLLVTMKRDAADPTKLSSIGATLCSIELPVVTALVGQCDPQSDTLVSTQIIAPKTLLDALPSVPAAPVAGALMGKAAGAALSIDRFTVTVGSSKPGASMPRWNDASGACSAVNLGRTSQCEMTCVDDCASLRDDDGDKFPGVTVEVCGKTPSDVQSGVACNAAMPSEPGTTLQGRGFIDMEVNPQFSGTAKSSCELLGTVDSTVVYNLVGADVYLAGTQIGATSAIKSLPSFKVDPSQSRFRMVRVDGKFGAPDWKIDPAQPAAACATVLARANEL